MTKAETVAFNAGVSAVIDLALLTAAAIDRIMVLKPTRYNFSAEALRGLAEEGRALLKRTDEDGPVVSSDEPKAPPASGAAAAELGGDA